jgi:uncharacterized protein GlcG (DUF336 family)
MMTLDRARLLIETAIEKAKQIGQPMNIAIVDAGANLAAFVRMDGAWLGSIDIAINKAFTAKQDQAVAEAAVASFHSG